MRFTLLKFINIFIFYFYFLKAFCFEFNELEIKPSIPFSLKFFENSLVLKQQFRNLKNMMFPKSLNAEKDEKNQSSISKKKGGTKGDERDYQKRLEQNPIGHSLDNSNESDSLTIEEILDTLMENEKQANGLIKKA